MTDLIIERRSGVVFATLNRPHALNALNFEIVRGLSALLDEAEADPKVVAVCILGAGDRAFCAGGDIKAAREAGLAWKAGQLPFESVFGFFEEEYALNRRMFRFTKPLIAVMNGITMGGGVGVAGACRYRIATEKTVWAMPEVTIGFFPDVGAGYYLTGSPGCAGTYLGLTGQHLNKATDLLTCGFATHYMKSEHIAEFLSHIEIMAGEDFLKETLHTLSARVPPEGDLNHDLIDRHFCFDTVDDIFASLAADGGEWERGIAALMRTKSPTSLKVTLKHLLLSAHETFDEVSLRDVSLARHFMQGHDFYEGVRAAVVDKDRSPKWQPATIEEVGEQAVMAYFS